MKATRGMEIKLQAFTTLLLDEGEKWEIHFHLMNFCMAFTELVF
jgi:hypothetical protein